MNTIRVLIVLVLILVGIVILFAVADHLLKTNSKKNEKKVEQPKAEQEVSVVEKKEEVVPTMKIYNSELADDLNEIIKQTEQEHSTRLKVDKHTNKEGNISKYIKRKNYQEFDFGGSEEEEMVTQEEDPISFTMDDYKRIMALSNIDDKK